MRFLAALALALALAACAARPADPAAPASGDAPATGDRAATGTLLGRATDASTGEPVPLVEVTARRDGAAVATDLSDSHGRVRLEGLAPGPHAITARWGALELTYSAKP